VKTGCITIKIYCYMDGTYRLDPSSRYTSRDGVSRPVNYSSGNLATTPEWATRHAGRSLEANDVRRQIVTKWQFTGQHQSLCVVDVGWTHAIGLLWT